MSGGREPSRAPYLLIAIAMMTGSQPEYSTSRVAAFFLAMMIQMGSRAMKKAHTRGFTYALLSDRGNKQRQQVSDTFLH